MAIVLRSAKLILILVVLVLTAWALRDGLNPDTGSVLPAEDEKDSLINVAGKTVQERIKVPEGFERVPVPEGSFGEYLRNLPLKPHGPRVRYYNGLPKLRNVQVAVLDIDVGERDLQQCADAVIRQSISGKDSKLRSSYSLVINWRGLKPFNKHVQTAFELFSPFLYVYFYCPENITRRSEPLAESPHFPARV